jgi:hypothetical protein
LQKKVLLFLNDNRCTLHIINTPKYEKRKNIIKKKFKF